MVGFLKKQVYSDSNVVSQDNKNLFQSFFWQGLDGTWQGISAPKLWLHHLLTILYFWDSRDDAPPKKAHASMFQIPTEIYPLPCKWVREWPTYSHSPYFIPESVNAINGTSFTRKRIARR